LGINAIAGSFFSLPEYGVSYERVILSHVLEHIYDLRGAIRSVHARMPDDGLVYIELPDACRYMETVFSPFQEFNTEHINHFSALACHNLMKLEGFHLEDQGGRLIECAPGKSYPIIYSCWSKDHCFERDGGLEKDDELKLKMHAYIVESQKIMKAVSNRFEDIMKRHSKIILWGTGQFLMKLLASSSINYDQIVAFVDGNPINHGKYINKFRIISPKDIIQSDEPILIVTRLHHQEIAETIRRMGISNEVLFI
jgi:hypothetical protein